MNNRRRNSISTGMKAGMQEPGDRLILLQMLLNDRVYITRLHSAIPDPIRRNLHRWT
jgi:hypothetical protein